MTTIQIPTVLRRLAGEQASHDTEAETVLEAIQELGATYPTLGAQLLQDGKVRNFVRIFLDGTDIQDLDGVDTKLAGVGVLRIVPAIAGGAER